MPESTKPPVGSIGWADLTVPDAPLLRDFYAQVIGWKAENVPMGGYDDYLMREPGSGKDTAGVCHARGGNQSLPNAWLIYIVVANLDESMRRCVRLGGSILAGPRSVGDTSRYCVIRDPGGAVCALYQAP